LSFLLSSELLRARSSINSMLQLIDNQKALYLKGLESGRGVSIAGGEPGLVLFYGLGGSGIVGHLASSMFSPESSAPLIVYTTSAPPSWITQDTLVVLISYSGETIEVLNAVNFALSKKAKMVAICSGGSLERKARESGVPLLKVTPNLTPRMAVPEMLGCVVSILESVNTVRGAASTLSAALYILDEGVRNFSAEAETPVNTAKTASLFLLDSLPHAISESTLYPVALRLKNQLNENAKLPCIVIDVPESMHNTLEALPQTERDRYIQFRWSGEDRLIGAQLEFLKKLLNQRLFEAHFMGGRVEAILQSTMWSDYVSIYLAALRNIDPAPVSKIAALRRELERLKT